MKDMEDYVPAQDKEETVIINEMTVKKEVNLVDKQWRDPDLRRIIKMIDDQEIVYFDREVNTASNIKTLVELAKQGKLLVERNVENKNKRMLVKVASFMNQMVIPRSARSEVMRRVHLHHQGVSMMVKELKKWAYWLLMALDVAQMVRKCLVYVEKANVNLHNGKAFDRGTNHVWEKIYVDLLGPFSPLSDNKYKYVLTVLDSYSCYIQAVSLENKRAETAAEALIFQVMVTEGPPQMIYSNQGTKFKNNLMKKIIKYFG